mmetsp:Transcript_16488/g.22788  ORF Transcript_16488/g.22788 Transcript_16488/m.22788 type:complete len:98 (-) Transcript_16488:213-506(-)|eukprot:CAMPEP_0196587314 /NCGR_PEP_ID=MMETSP1081-20130531/57101_1 /TAXON_ID=36882 /ORGANISM="Pyramimonas amylifera, Strain CCMP720" /LENGTH=97 /DNA_ID=CAMNT_0041909469 /DNA_START=244 /DNA_END=537 /DNA_ORIENTATION=+
MGTGIGKPLLDSTLEKWTEIFEILSSQMCTRNEARRNFLGAWTDTILRTWVAGTGSKARLEAEPLGVSQAKAAGEQGGGHRGVDSCVGSEVSLSKDQ